MSRLVTAEGLPTALGLAELTINDLVAAYPETMTVLAPLGIDLCCGGAHPLGVALDLHGYDRPAVIERIIAVIEESADKGR